MMRTQWGQVKRKNGGINFVAQTRAEYLPESAVTTVHTALWSPRSVEVSEIVDRTRRQSAVATG